MYKFNGSLRGTGSHSRLSVGGQFFHIYVSTEEEASTFMSLMKEFHTENRASAPHSCHLYIEVCRLCHRRVGGLGVLAGVGNTHGRVVLVQRVHRRLATQLPRWILSL
jgi:hypothetical protein